MQGILHLRYYNLDEGRLGKYIVQTRSQAKCSGIKLPEVHGVGKKLDPNILAEKQIIKPIATSEEKGTSQIKPRLGQGREGLKCKIKTAVPLQLIYIL